MPSAATIATVPPEDLPALALSLAAAQAAVAVRLLGTIKTATVPQPDTLLNVAQAALRLGVSRHWLYRRASALPFVRRLSTRALRFSTHGIDRWLRMPH